MTPLSFVVGLAESVPSLWSVAGSIPVTTINKTITNSCTIQTCSDVSVNC